MKHSPLSPHSSSPYSSQYMEVETDEEPLQELTLDALRLAFVEVDREDGGHEDGVHGDSSSETEDTRDTFGEAAVIPTTPETVLEAILFVGNSDNSPITMEKCCELLRNVTPDEIRHIVDSLNHRYETVGAPQRIVWEPETRLSLRMILHDSFQNEVEKFSGKTRETQLSQTAIEVLALIAYRQPITAEEIQQIRKTSVGSLLTQLVRRELLTAHILQKDTRKVTQYRTTRRFLDIFGLASLDDLPTADEMEGV